MARKVKFPLNMGKNSETGEDIMVRDIIELRDKYNADKITGYFINGRLLTWLEDRYYEEEAEQVRKLSEITDKEKAAEMLPAVFKVKTAEKVDVKAVEWRNEKLKKLRDITSDDEVLDNVDFVAFSQTELDELVYQSTNKIYLYDDPDRFMSFPFAIDTDIENVQYIGINKPRVLIIYDCDGLVWDNENAIVFIKEKNISVKKCDVENVFIGIRSEMYDVIAESNDDFELEYNCLKKYNGNSEIVKIPDNVNVIGKDAFHNCRSVKKIIIPDSVSMIGGWAFSNCENLENVNIPVGVTKIEYNVFENCKKLTAVHLPPNVTNIRSNAFYGCDSYRLKIFYRGREYSMYQIDTLYSHING